ncbi:unnamed protein product [Lupinus luteus]|uniref:DUF4283 domain-containing protein n=1 Tax=Lupinus luteus TaxID=3873 RepID=A0AAV1WL38_LUPLU
MVKRDLVAEKLMTIAYEECNALVPHISLDKEVFEELCSPRRDALVITLVGKPLNYNVFKDRLQRIWKLQGGFDMVDVDHGFYYVKFDLEVDIETVIGGGPWMLFNHYVEVACWTPEFVAPMAKVDRTMVWIPFPSLNMVYYDESFILSLTSCVGRPVKVDTNTLRATGGRYASVGVEIDLTKPVVGRHNLGGHFYKVMYEGLHVICKTCGCYGHVTRNFSSNTTVAPPLETGTTEEQVLNVAGENYGKNDEHPSNSTTITNSLENYGEWLTVTRKKRLPKKNAPNTFKNPKDQQPEKNEARCGGKSFIKPHAYSSRNGYDKVHSITSTVGTKIANIPSLTFGELHNSGGPPLNDNNSSI